jgi:FdrA protein
LLLKTLIKPSAYHDSVSLMLVARQLAALPGIQDAAVVMATEANKSILEGAGMLDESVQAASPNDLVLAVIAEDEGSASAALEAAGALLAARAAPEGEGAARRPRSLRRAAADLPGANLAVISVAGRYAAGEAWEALLNGLHVLLFSDNVSLEDEIALKRYAVEHGLLLMGPGAGTAILNGVGLGFANAVPRGPVGLVSAAGTGLQEVSTLLARHGIGLSQGIGVGGRDLKLEVGGLMMLAGLEALQHDPHTSVIVLVSKPPAPQVVAKMRAALSASSKPTVVCFLGGDLAGFEGLPHVTPAHTLRDAALHAARLAGADLPPLPELLAQEERQLFVQAQALKAGLAPGQRYLRGLFSGGTLCYEAQVIWRDCLPEAVYSNAPLPGGAHLEDSTRSQEHTVVDLGEEEFTVGRPHPMIDNDLRLRRLLAEAADPETALILLDVVLGYGAHPDPASEIGPAVQRAASLARADGRSLVCLASVTGTELDPQSLSRTTAALQRSGVVVCDSNAAAARLAAMVITEINPMV